MEEVKSKTKTKSKLLLTEYFKSCSDCSVDVGYGSDNVMLGVGLYDLNISASTYLNDFKIAHFLFVPKVKYIPNPQYVIDWLTKVGVTNQQAKFVSPRIHRIVGTYEGINMKFDIIIG